MEKERSNCTCLIPFYNEEKRIAAVLGQVTHVENISQIICIDDGSSDKGSEIIRARFKSVKVVEMGQNAGKSAAIKRGLEEVKTEYVFLMDADLQDLKVDDITDAIAAIQTDDKIDMLILRRMNAPWWVKLDRGDVLFCGIRILKKKDLEEVFRSAVNRYQLEIAINGFMQDNGKKVCWTPTNYQNTFKMDKWGFLTGLRHEIEMFRDMISYAGLGNFLRQIMTFGKDKLE